MIFWDSSAVVPLIVRERSSSWALQIAEQNPVMALWCLSRVEVASAIERRVREGALDEAQRNAGLDRLAAFARAWDEVRVVEPVRQRAIRLLALHSLRAADSLQLGAALVLCGDDPRLLPFATADIRLAQAASREGFEVLQPPA